MDVSNAEKTITSLFQSKMIGKEVNFLEVKEPEEDSSIDLTTREFKVINFNF